MLLFLVAVVIVTFDLSDVESMNHVHKWKEDACQSAYDPLVFLVGTKKDLLVKCNLCYNHVILCQKV